MHDIGSHGATCLLIFVPFGFFAIASWPGTEGDNEYGVSRIPKRPAERRNVTKSVSDSSGNIRFRPNESDNLAFNPDMG